MMKKAALLAVTLLSAPVFAADGQSVTTDAGLLSHLAAGLSSTVHGPAINHLGENTTVDSTGTKTAPGKSDIYFDTTATLGYKLAGGDVVASAYVPFFLFPSADAGNATSNFGDNFVLGDAGLQFSVPHAYKNGGLSVSANLTLQAPTSDYAQNVTKMALGIKTTPSVRYVFNGSRWSLGSFFEFKEYAGTVKKQKSLKTWYLPYVQYKLLGSLDARLGFEYEASHINGAGPALSVVTADFQPGLVWFVTPKVFVNPYLQIFTNKTVDTDHMALAAYVSASI